MGSEWQRDWLIEAGHWALAAKWAGFADDIRKRLKGARDEVILEKDPNDNAHRKLNTELAEPMVVHYLTGIGWTFLDRGLQARSVDIDLVLAAPTSEPVAMQVKAPDVYGSAPYRHNLGGDDEYIRRALDKAASQLPMPAQQPSMVVLCAQSGIELCGATEVVESPLYGRTWSEEGNAGVYLSRAGLGKFASNWRHIGAVLALNYRRGDPPDYCCTVLLNPWAEDAARCRREWFPHSRILWLDGDVFRWDRGQPAATFVPDGTQLVSDS